MIHSKMSLISTPLFSILDIVSNNNNIIRHNIIIIIIIKIIILILYIFIHTDNVAFLKLNILIHTDDMPHLYCKSSFVPKMCLEHTAHPRFYCTSSLIQYIVFAGLERQLKMCFQITFDMFYRISLQR